MFVLAERGVVGNWLMFGKIHSETPEMIRKHCENLQKNILFSLCEVFGVAGILKRRFNWLFKPSICCILAAKKQQIWALLQSAAVLQIRTGLSALSSVCKLNLGLFCRPFLPVTAERQSKMLSLEISLCSLILRDWLQCLTFTLHCWFSTDWLYRSGAKNTSNVVEKRL